MPLPWKKTKSNRISRIVADLQPPSRAASLVVETGFPASVVDLFVKNRDRIKRHSLKKSKHKHSSLHASESMAPPPTPSLTPEDSPRLPADEAVAVLAAGQGLDDLLEKSAAATDVELNVAKNANEIAIANENENLSVIVLAAKMLLAVVPVLSSTKLALWIILFAFLLEIVGHFVARFFDLSSIQNQLLSTTNADAEREIPPINSDEIQILESNSDYEPLESGESCLNQDKEIGCSSYLGMEIEEEAILEMEKNQRSRSSKLRAKIIKKLIPKKLRSGKRMKKNKNKMKEEEGSVMIMENEQGAESSCEEEQEEHEVWEVQQIWEPEEEEEQEEEQVRDERKMNLESKIVIVMILLGLCGSRFLALVLAVSGSFMFKFIKSLYPKCKFW